MATSSFTHTSGITAGITRTLAYGPVPANTTVIVFSGTLANVDSLNQTTHLITVESYNGTTYTPHLKDIPVPYGSTSKCPKVVLNTGDSLYVTADATSSVTCRFELLVRA